MKRSAGILLSVSSLPSPYGIGCFSESAYQFIDWLKDCGQTYWQILPLGPTSYGDSPYQSFSTFAGNPYFISLEEFIASGLLTKTECDNADMGSVTTSIDYGKLYKERYRLLRKAYQNSKTNRNYNENAYLQFCNEHHWLNDYALFMAVKDKFGGVAWNEWDEDIRLRTPKAMAYYTETLSEEIGFYKFLQFHFFSQWNKLKSYANQKGIRIIGDIPIYVAFDSADTWANPQLFQLDQNNLPTAVAGCPPDGFSADGQLWGNPLYDWKRHKADGFQWWISRLAHCFCLYDVVRIDHFRGFDEYFSIPYGDKTAQNGHWEKGPGMDLFHAVTQALGQKDVIAEDLGFVTDSVRKLVNDSGFPNMKVLEFAFDARDTGNRNDYLPHNYDENCVAYTGTHDNQTITSWFETITEEERKMAKDYLLEQFPGYQKLHSSGELHMAFIHLIMNSNANLCIIPLQDYLGLDDDARMNTPSTVGENWKWRMTKDDMNAGLSKKIRTITETYHRLSM